ncbi:general secretion pathway protein [Flavobacterium zepuense]|uniref:General secretion pathway protein n=1 Tax=Flavobacterium zepuense TaxID=2593302 RepID=A0A552V9D2_9FLAO|nr:general secretion pathway protein [Flavobacterium zepuense]
MIDVALKFSLIVVLLLIFWQDTKERLVLWFLYPLVGVVAYMLHAKTIGVLPSIVNTGLNLVFVLIILSISYLYIVVIKRRKYLNESIGAGDLLFFVSLPFAFATVAFTLLFVFSLLFSLLLHMIFKNRQVDKTVPLAGYMALFFATVYCISFFTKPQYLFSY